MFALCVSDLCVLMPFKAYIYIYKIHKRLMVRVGSDKEKVVLKSAQ